MPKTMTSKERMLAALSREVPDRLPASVHQWQTYHLDHFLGGISALSAFRRFGLDAAVVAPPVYSRTSTTEWRVESRTHRNDAGNTVTEVTIETPDGILTQLLEADDRTQWVVEPIIKRPEDMPLVTRFMPIPLLDPEPTRALYQEVGEDGIVRAFVFGDQGGPWQHACQLHGTQKMIMATYDDPAWVHELLRVLTDKKVQYVEESLRDLPVDLVETGGGAASSTVISPTIFQGFCLPYDREIHRALHEAGHRVVYHTCGGMMPILDLITANECDASETLAPAGVGGDADAEGIKQRIGGQVALIGGLDQHNVLTAGTPEEIRAEVHRLFRALGPGGGYIISPSDHFFDTSAANLQAYADAARECLYE